MLWQVPLDLGGWSCIAILSISLNLGLSSRWFHFFGTWIPRILQFLGQPLAWAFGYWMVSWRMHGCGNPFKHFFLQNIRTTFLPPFYFDPGECSTCISSFWSFKPFDFCIHAFPALFHVSELTCELWISLEISQGQFLTPTHKFKLTPSQLPKGSPACICSPPSICPNYTLHYLSGLTPSPIYSPHTLCPLFLVFYCTSIIPLHYICMLVSTFLP